MARMSDRCKNTRSLDSPDVDMKQLILIPLNQSTLASTIRSAIHERAETSQGMLVEGMGRYATLNMIGIETSIARDRLRSSNNAMRSGASLSELSLMKQGEKPVIYRR